MNRHLFVRLRYFQETICSYQKQREVGCSRGAKKMVYQDLISSSLRPSGGVSAISNQHRYRDYRLSSHRPWPAERLIDQWGLREARLLPASHAGDSRSCHVDLHAAESIVEAPSFFFILFFENRQLLGLHPADCQRSVLRSMVASFFSHFPLIPTSLSRPRFPRD